MRDAHRMKEKFDLSLDNRQIGSLLIAGIVVMGSVFVLGVVVGKKLASSEEVGAAPDILTALDARAAALDDVRDASLTFPDELTRKTPSVPEPAPPPVVQAAAPEKPRPAEPATSEPALAASPPAGNVEATVTATRIKDAGAPPQTATPRPPTGTAADGAFTLQLSASQSRVDAERFATRLRDRGYAPYIVEAQVEGKGTWYRVRMGSFSSKDAASRYLRDFRRETQLDAFVAAK